MISKWGDRIEGQKISWHPGFYGAAELEFLANKEDLEFHPEYNLSKEPLRMDLLIIKKLTDAVIVNEIGRIFRKHNVVEYKSPDDGLTIDDFYKTIGYACLYKGFGTTVNQIPAEEITVSIFREGYPREMMKALQIAGMSIEEMFHGVYYVSGNLPFQTQIVIMNQLDEIHPSLRVLSRRTKESDIKAFLDETMFLHTPGERNNASAVLQVSMSANVKLYQLIRRNMVMCDALRELMKDDLDQRERDTLLRSVKNVMEALSFDADKAMDILKVPAADREIYRDKL